MGLLGGFIVYSLGKRRGRKQATRRLAQEYGAQPEPLGQQDCIHYWSFCKNYGSCDGMTCEIGE